MQDNTQGTQLSSRQYVEVANRVIRDQVFGTREDLKGKVRSLTTAPATVQDFERFIDRAWKTERTDEPVSTEDVAIARNIIIQAQKQPTFATKFNFDQAAKDLAIDAITLRQAFTSQHAGV